MWRSIVLNTLNTRWLGLSINNRIVFIFRCGVLATCGFCILLLGHPPAKAQRQQQVQQIVPTERVVTAKDEAQDIAISKFEEFKNNQENWNHQTGKQISDQAKALEENRLLAQSNAVAISHIDGGIGGGLALIAVFTFGAMIFQLKKKTG